jgi:hypothetical protein
VDRETPAETAGAVAGDTQLVLMAVDPYLVYAYWSVPSSAIDPQAQATLRFHDIADLSSFDVDVDLQSRNWYVHLWSPEKRYFVDLGFRREDGGFIALARSNVVETPPAWPRLKVGEAVTLLEPAEAPAAAPAAPPVPETAVPPVPEPAESAGSGEAIRGHSGLAATDRSRPEDGRRVPEIASPLPRTPAPPEDELYSDLTDMSEKKYTSGVSSLLVRSRRSGQ